MARMSIEPADPPDGTELREMLAHAGVHADAVERLVPSLVEPHFQELGLDADAEDGEQIRKYLDEIVHGISNIFATYQNWEPAFVHVVLCFMGALPAEWWRIRRPGVALPAGHVLSRIGNYNVPAWLGHLLDADIQWAPGLATVHRMMGGHLDAEVLLTHLAKRPEGYPIWDDALDWDAEEKGLRTWSAADNMDPSRPWLWLRNAPWNTNGMAKMLFEDHAVAFVERAKNAGGLRESLAISMVLRDAAHETLRRSSSGFVFSRVDNGPLQLLREALAQDLPGLRSRALDANASPAALRAWLESASWVAAQLPGEAPVLNKDQEDHRAEAEALVAAAGLALGRTRQQLRADEPVDQTVAIASLRVLRWLEGPAMALRHVQQLMASANGPCTGEDLRYYDEEGLPAPPDPSWIPKAAAWVVNSMTVDEKDDPSLEVARGDVASFLLRRLKSRGESTEEGVEPMEPRPEWRIGIIRAVDDLQVNPGGKGHHVLHRVSQDDPDEDVRRAAGKFYEKMRHVRGGEKLLTPRVKFLRAFWWLRYAQRAALNLDVNEPRARSVRSREVSRTQAAYWL